MVCPNKNTDEWKELVAKHGPLMALGEFIDNGYQIPSASETVVREFKGEKLANIKSLDKFITVKQKQMDAINTNINNYKFSDKGDSIDKMTKDLEALHGASVVKSMLLMMRNAKRDLTALNTKMDTIDGNLYELKKVHDYSSAYMQLSDLSTFIRDTSANITDENRKRLLSELHEVVGEAEAFHKRYVEEGREALVDALAPHVDVIRGAARHMYQREYTDNNPPYQSTLKRDDWEKERDAWVDKKLSDDTDLVTIKTKNYLREQLTLMPQDTSTLAAYMSDPKGLNDVAIKAAATMMDRADHNVKNLFIDNRSIMIEAEREFSEGQSTELNTDQKKKYEGIVELDKDGNHTGYMVGSVYNHIFDEYNDLARMSSDKTIEPTTKLDAYREFINNTVKAGGVKTFLSGGFRIDGKKLDAVQLFELDKALKTPDYTKTDEGRAFIKRLTVERRSVGAENHPIYATVKEEHKNPQWKTLNSDPRKLKMWRAIQDFNKHSDNLSKYSKLGYRLPNIRKSKAEALKDEGWIELAKESIADIGKLNQNDVEQGALESIDGVTKVKVNADGSVVQKINIPYRRMSDYDVKDQSFDLVGMSLANRYVALNYNEKAKIKSDMEVLKDIFADRKVGAYKGMDKVVTDVKNFLNVSEEEHRDVLQSGLKSNSYKVLESIIEDRIYGKGSKDAPEIFGQDLNKISNSLMKWSSHQMLIGNYLGATSNVLQGKVMNYMEGVKGNHFDRKQLRKAEKEYWSDLKGSLDDIGALKPKGMTNLLMERFVGTAMDFDMFTSDLIKDTKAKRLLDTKTLHGLNASAEHYIQGTLMYAVLEGAGVNIKDFKIGKDGELIVPEGMDTFALERKVKGIIKRIQGNYDPQNKSIIRRYWAGRLGEFLRKWIVSGVQRRYRGINTTGKSFDELLAEDPSKVYYAEDLGEFEEGHYTSAIRFMRQQFTNLKSLKMDAMKQDWSTLSDMERSNIQATVTEALLIAASYTASMLLLGLAEDEDDDTLYGAAYLMRRAYGELMFFNPANPGEMLRVMRTPSALFSTVELGMKLFAQVASDAVNLEAETYDTGRHKDQVKSLRYLGQLTFPPYRSIIDVDNKEKLKFLMNF